ncbi:MAG: glycosyl hydrolase [Verrucomicrobia bacterium]|nr:glycosyl hydrolase [Verrucomicrobiota bacterium]
MSPNQLLILGVPGPELTAEDIALYRAVMPGGFVLFTRNIVSPEQTRTLTDDLRDLCGPNVLICIDNEGGRVWRTAPFGHSPPSADQLRAKGNSTLIAQAGWIAGRQLRMLGINLNLAPVLDIDHHPGAANALRGRCWGHTDQEVINNAGTFNRYQRKQGILGCAKHFPAGGRATLDPHHDLPQVGAGKEELMRSDILPYTALMPELDTILLAHIHFPLLDPEHPNLPSSLSRNIVTRFLRDQLGYERLVMTDDLDMGAIRKQFGTSQAARMAIEAGCDLALLCHELSAAPLALAEIEKAPATALSDALERVYRTQKTLYKPTRFSAEKFAEINDDIWKLRVDTLGEDGASLPPDTPTQSPVEDY